MLHSAMGSPYPIELRERAIAALDSGMSKWQVHKTFNISRSTLDHWLKRREATGSLAASTAYRRGPEPAIDDREATREFIEAHKEQTLAQMCEAWQAQTGQRVSDVTMSHTLKRLGYSRKKRVTVTTNEIS